LLKIRLPDDLKSLGMPLLPKGWQNQSSVTQTIGNQWLDENQSPVFVVPSAIVPEAINYLINPLHPNAALIKIESVQSVPLDGRLK
jgi:RES domain-containing protein